MDETIEAKIRHLEMIQGIMTRMSTNSFMLKGWSITLVAGVFVLSAKESNPIYFLIAYTPIILFWFLDSYYLMIERQYGHLYNLIAEKMLNEIDFKMNRPKSNRNANTCYDQCMLSTTEVFFYIPTALLTTTVVILGQFF